MARAGRSIGTALVALALAVPAGAAWAAAPGGGSGDPPAGVDPGWLALARQTLSEGDGWGSAGSGTTGGSAAAPGDVHVVRTWDELRAALGGASAHLRDEPTIVLVEGEMRAFGFDDPASGLPTCDDFAAQVQVEDDDPRPFSMAEYVAAYDPEVWGWTDPTGPLEEARARAAAVQTAQVRQRVGPHVTVLGLGDDARLVGAHLLLQGVRDVIIRNLHVSDAYDCFPEWDPGDTSVGNWNSLYDNISVHTSENVWVDHVTLDDGDHPPASLPTVHGRPFEVHDGLLDITHESDLVTVSYSVFRDHDKTNLVGSGDGRQALDGGRLRVSWHHNLWDDAGQRLPRVRFGDVDVYNNYVRVGAGGAALFDYAWGVGVESSIWAERNAFDLPEDVPVASIVKRWGGSRLHAEQTLVNGVEVDVLGAYNAAAAEADRLVAGARWDPVTAGVRGAVVHEVTDVRDVVLAQAGAGVLAPAAEGPDVPDPAPSTPVVPPGGGSGGGGAANGGPGTGVGGPGSDGIGAGGTGAGGGAGGGSATAEGARRGGLAATGVGALGVLAGIGALVGVGVGLVRARRSLRG
ncbi:polysaccharide lyase family 1 protein [Cellulomonas sp. PS-H5]|uniref:pectate lyase family protein n=1 Tax=Cellulomonas sp. PS-H5 TaxID=2820400 RepID=UPI001C4F976A|nr:polysaccharide lyase family 1 protein [Cellulomonas sp. PS-H5]MBW0254722.1 polysaccharide lyase family 1 protein [Cellulomonas sp. PS-H5]